MFFIYFSFVKLQITDIITDTTTILPDTFEFDNSTITSFQVTILGALTNAEHIKILNHTTINSNTDLNISSQSFILDSNPLLTMSKLCKIGDVSHAKIIIAGHSIDNNDLTLSAISYVSDFYHIPVITIASRENLFSDKVNRKIIECNKI